MEVFEFKITLGTIIHLVVLLSALGGIYGALRANLIRMKDDQIELKEAVAELCKASAISIERLKAIEVDIGWLKQNHK